MRRSSDSISHVTYSLVRAVLRRSAVLNPGDVLYIPRGWPHVAEAEGGAPSTHMTMTLHAQDFTWESLLRFFVLTGTGKETVFPPPPPPPPLPPKKCGVSFFTPSRGKV
eukprot:COSAG06_NODE_16816_length_978_cov_1009.078498_1_plen_108_part_10